MISRPAADQVQGIARQGRPRIAAGTGPELHPVAPCLPLVAPVIDLDILAGAIAEARRQDIRPRVPEGECTGIVLPGFDLPLVGAVRRSRRRESRDRGPVQKAQNAGHRIAAAARPEAEAHIGRVAPVEAAAGPLSRIWAASRKPRAGEHLTGVGEVDGDRRLGHQSAPSSSRRDAA